MIIAIGTTPTVQRTMVFEHLVLDAVNRAAVTEQYPSGKGINVARVVHTLGYPALATGFLGGYSGEVIRRELDREHIPHQFVNVSAATRTCTTAIDRSAGTVTELVEESAAVGRDAFDRLMAVINSALPRASGMALSGTLPPGAPENFCAWCIQRAHAFRLPVILDARGPAMLRALREHPTLTKPNAAELGATLGSTLKSDSDLCAAIRQLTPLGARWVLVTRGKEPAILSDGDRFWRITAPTVETVNPIGSGDAVTAGILVELARGTPMLQAIPLGFGCGAANAMTERCGHIRLENAQRLREQVGVEPMS